MHGQFVTINTELRLTLGIGDGLESVVGLVTRDVVDWLSG